MIRQPPFRVLEGVLFQVERLAFSGQVVELAFLYRAADLLFSIGHG
jgi:hypothetical protein